MNVVTVESVKREAKAIARATTVTHSQALAVLAVQAGHSHWGSYQAAIVESARLQAERAARTISPIDLLEAVTGPLGHIPPAIREARHIILSGTTSTGKTTLMRRIMEAAPKRVPIAVIERHPEMINPNPVAGYVPDPASLSDRRPASWQAAHDAATSAGAGLIVYDEVSVTNAAVILASMRDAGCPTVMSTIHAADPREAALLMSQRSRQDPIRPKDGIICVQMKRDPQGRRTITDVVLM